MTSFFNLRIFSLAAAVALLAPTASEAREIKIRRDLDGDGHFNTKRIDVGRRGWGGGGRYYGGWNRGYYGRGYYGRGIGYPFGWNYPAYGRYGYGYGYGYPYAYSPGISFSYVSRPRSAYSDEAAANSLAAEVQSALKRRGYYKGAIDGDIGPGSRAAIRAYQYDKRLKVTGRIDRDLLDELDIG